MKEIWKDQEACTVRADRLLSILLLMQDGGKYTAGELARRLEVSERTVVRDMEALSMAGVPVYAHRGHNGGWQLSEGYRTALSGLSRDDVRLLLLARMSRMFEDLGIGKESERLLGKVTAGLDPASRQAAEAVKQRIHIDGAGWRDSMEKFPNLPLLYEAVWSERKVRFRYGSAEEPVERELSPLGLVAKGNTWYVVGMSGGELRTYRVSRVLAVVAVGEPFARPEGFELAEYWEKSTAEFIRNLPHYPVAVRIREEAMRRLSAIRYVSILGQEACGDGRISKPWTMLIERRLVSHPRWKSSLPRS
jgi:predicted DNA-binding transcriptional regulator YafY